MLQLQDGHRYRNGNGNIIKISKGAPVWATTAPLNKWEFTGDNGCAYTADGKLGVGLGSSKNDLINEVDDQDNDLPVPVVTITNPGPGYQTIPSHLMSGVVSGGAGGSAAPSVGTPGSGGGSGLKAVNTGSVNLNGKRIVFTGAIPGMTRFTATKAAMSVGAHVDKTVTASTDYLITDPNSVVPGSGYNTVKAEAALKYNTPIMSPNDFKKSVNQSGPTGTKLPPPQKTKGFGFQVGGEYTGTDGEVYRILAISNSWSLPIIAAKWTEGEAFPIALRFSADGRFEFNGKKIQLMED